MKKLGNWLIKIANIITQWWDGIKCKMLCKWNKMLLFISFNMSGCDNKICTCKK